MAYANDRHSYRNCPDWSKSLKQGFCHMLPLVNLVRLHDELRGPLQDAFNSVLTENAFIGGSYVKKFEDEFAALHRDGIEEQVYCVGVSNGTSSLSLLLEAYGVKAGDEVIVPAHTFAATAESVRHVGATPVFADINGETYNIDPASVSTLLTPRTRAVVPVHLYGSPADLPALANVVKNRPDIVVIEDNAQSHFSKLGGRTTGVIGHAASFSFYPGKNLGACGDAGAILTTDPEIARVVGKLRDHGRMSKYEHDLVGYNHRMDGLQAALLSVKLPHMKRWTVRRQELAKAYDDCLRAEGFKTITVLPEAEAVYHLFVVEVSNRDDVMQHLASNGIASGVHYPVPLHRQPAFVQWANGNVPVTEAASTRVMSLPICPYLTDEEQAHVLEKFLQVARR